MEKYLRFITFVIITFLFLIGIFDYGNIILTKNRVKDALDISSKAAALQIDMDTNKIQYGIFEIDPIKSEIEFNKYLNKNLPNTDYEITEMKVINAHSPTTINLKDGAKVEIKNPTVFATAKFKYDGIFIKKEFTVQTSAGTQVQNRNDLKNFKL